ncbi:MAG: hypothetical protein ACRCUM_04080 [Mycoplasmoidaceae bacterium]
MKNDFKEMKYFIEYQHKSNIKESSKNFLSEIISFFHKNIENAFIPYSDISKLSKDELISALDLFYYIESKILDIRSRKLESVDLKLSENDFFKIIANFDIEFKLYFIFKISFDSNMVFLTPEEIKKIADKKRNCLVVNLIISESEQYQIEILNITDCYNLKKIKSDRLKKVYNYETFKDKEVIYVREIYYNDLKNKKLITK